MVLNLPLDECIGNTRTKVTREKRKKKKRTKRNSNKRSKVKQRQRARSLEEDKSRTLRQGHQLDTSETKTKLKQRAQTTEPKLKHHKELPLHTCNSP
jgi:hypothetical protein